MRYICTSIVATLMLTGMSFAEGECADTNGDADVNIIDLLAVISDWGECVGCSGDVDGSGTVNVIDLLAVLDDWGECDGDNGDGLFNYGEALQKALTFYFAQRAGVLPDTYPLNWRSDCFDYALEQVNGTYVINAGIHNRYMDAGDSPTFVLPISFAMTSLAWSGIDFSAGFQDAHLMDDLKETLRWHADWCIAAHPEPNVFCGQIGQGAGSHNFWVPPEVYTQVTGYEPKIWWLNEDHPGSEPTAEAAAFLAAASIVFEDDEDGYADTLLVHARQLYTFADTYPGNYTKSIPDAASFYNSWSGYQDELTWAAVWLHRATGEQDYLDRAEAHYNDAALQTYWVQSWDGKMNGAAVLLAALTGKQQYKTDAETYLNNWLPSGGITYTPGGLAWISQWGSLRYAANTAFIAFAYVKLVGDHSDARYRTLGESQINYILGNNPRASSYVCGFGQNPPQFPHHRGGHGSWDDDIDDPDPNRHVLWGALVGGPASADDFNYADVRSNYIDNEVACDYNAGFAGSLAFLSMRYGGDPLPENEFPPAEDAYGKEMFVEASVIETTDTSTLIQCRLNNRSAWPARMSEQLSFRIYLDLTEVITAGFEPSDVTIESDSLDGGSIGPLVAVDPGANLYAFEVSYLDEVIGPGSSTLYWRKCQLQVGLSNGAPPDAWDTSNDPSIIGLPVGENMEQTETIPVYDAGVLVYGTEAG